MFSLFLVVLASVVLVLHLSGLLNGSLYPSGVGAALHYKTLVHGWSPKDLSPHEVIFQFFVSFISALIGSDMFTVLKVTSLLIIGLVPVLTGYLAFVVTGSRLVTVCSAWLVSFMPQMVSPLIAGNYGVVLGSVFLVAYLISLLSYSKRINGKWLLATLISEVFAVLSNVNSALMVLAILVSLSVLSFRRPWKYSLRRLSTLCFICFLIPLFALFARGLPLAESGFGFWVDPSFWLGDLWFVVPLALSVVAGTLSLFEKGVARVPLFFILMLVVVPLVSVFVPFSSLYVVAAPFLAILASSSILWFKEALSSSEMEGNKEEPIIEVTIDIPKTVALVLTLVSLLSVINTGYATSFWLYDQNSISKFFIEKEVSSAVQWISENLPVEATLSSRVEAAAWLEALSGRSVLGFRGLDEELLADTLDSAGFRILTPSLMVDEWEPFSVSKAPRISCYDGTEYRPIAYIDDSFVRVNLVESNETWIESPYRSTYGGFEWLSQTYPEVILVQYFETPGLFFEKTLIVVTSEPTVQILYRIVPKLGVELLGLELPVRIEPWREVSILGKTENQISMNVDGKETQISYHGEIVNLRHQKYDEGHAMVLAEFKPEKGMIEVSVTVSLGSDARSKMPVWTAYTPDLIRTYNVEYILAESGTRGFLDRSFADPVNCLIMKDSFNRIMFQGQGENLVEAPSNGIVLFDQDLPNGSSLIGYETGWLHINKTLTLSEQSSNIAFSVVPLRSNSSLTNMTLTLWVDWSVLLLDYIIQGNTLKVNLSSNEFEIRFAGDIVNVEVGPDPIWEQNRIQATFNLESEGDEVGVNIRNKKNPVFRYQKTSRPVMEADDQLFISINRSPYTIVFKQGALVICRTNC